MTQYVISVPSFFLEETIEVVKRGAFPTNGDLDKSAFALLKALFQLTDDDEFEDADFQAPFEMKDILARLNEDRLDIVNHYLIEIPEVWIKLKEGRFDQAAKRNLINNLKFRHLSRGFTAKSSIMLCVECVIQELFGQSLFLNINNDGRLYLEDAGSLMKDLLEIPIKDDTQEAANTLLFRKIGAFALKKACEVPVYRGVDASNVIVSIPNRKVIENQMKKAAETRNKDLNDSSGTFQESFFRQLMESLNHV